jgi:hypothetical protein
MHGVQLQKVPPFSQKICNVMEAEIEDQDHKIKYEAYLELLRK